MFGQGLPIRDRFANFRMDYIDFSNLIGDERYHDRLNMMGAGRIISTSFYVELL